MLAHRVKYRQHTPNPGQIQTIYAGLKIGTMSLRRLDVGTSTILINHLVREGEFLRGVEDEMR